MSDTPSPHAAKEVEARYAAIRQAIGAQGFARLLGTEISELASGACTLEVARRDDLTNQHGMFHGGVTAYLIDNATTIAAGTLLKPGQAVLTAEYKLNLLAPAKGERLVCRARVIKPGRTLTVASADVFSLADGVERHVATAIATIATIETPGKP